MTTYTHIIRQGYGSPEVDHTMPRVAGAVPSADGLQMRLQVGGLVQSHVHDFDLSHVRSTEDNPLVHANACYTLNDIPHN
jgi:hypothetical protein